MKGLQALGQAHPFIGGKHASCYRSLIAHVLPVAVGAFVLVVTMDITRRDNDRKVVAVKMKMQELMMVFFE